jgi:hypothetical protein
LLDSKLNEQGICQMRTLHENRFNSLLWQNQDYSKM